MRHRGPVPRARSTNLIAALVTSGCAFQRNGRWHEAAQAQGHLRKKYAWLRNRGLVDSAEQFVERAAARAASVAVLTGRCPGRPPVRSAAWLRARLAQLRRHDAIAVTR